MKRFLAFLLLGNMCLAHNSESMDVYVNNPTGKLEYGKGHKFIGVQVGAMPTGVDSSVMLGLIGGYHYYLPESLQFGSVRQGVRGYGGMDWFGRSGTTFLCAGVNYTIDFNPQSRNIWGIFGGVSTSHAISHLAGGVADVPLDISLGTSLEINKTHRIEISAGW